MQFMFGKWNILSHLNGISISIYFSPFNFPHGFFFRFHVVHMFANQYYHRFTWPTTTIATTHALSSTSIITPMATYYNYGKYGMKTMRKNRLSIVNMVKSGSLYNEGMRPLMYSDIDATESKIGWRRCGENIAYFKNEDSTYAYDISTIL